MNNQPYNYPPQGSYQPGQPVTPPTTPLTPLAPHPKKDRSGLIKTIAIIILALLTAVFIGLFVWMYVQWSDVKTDVDGQIDQAVAIAVNQRETELEAEFAEREKYPYNTFAGPADYGSLTFEYPKTWSLYIPEDGAGGTDFRSYFNPGQVNITSDTTVMSLRVSILSRQTDDVLTEYNGYVENNLMSVTARLVNGVNINLFQGQLPSGLRGYVAVLKIRDKTAIIQTDAELFADDYFRVLDTIRYNN